MDGQSRFQNVGVHAETPVSPDQRMRRLEDMHNTEIKNYILKELARFTEAASKVRKSPTEGQGQK